jgi:peroxiredoxin
VSDSRRDRYYRYAFVALGLTLAASAAANLWLSQRRARERAASTLAAGTAMPVFRATDLEGGVRTLDLRGSDQPTVVYVFAPNCIWCTRNLANVKTLVAQGKGRYRFVGLALTNDLLALRHYVAEQGLDFPVFARLAGEPDAMRRLASSAPQTIVVSPDGIVIRSWAGAYTSDDAVEVESYFQLRLPGLATDG